MAELEMFGEPEWVPVPLVAENVLGGAHASPPGELDEPSSGLYGAEIGRRSASVGVPQVRPLLDDDPYLDDEARAFVVATPGAFHLVRLNFDVKSADSEHLEAAMFGVIFTGGAIGWSLSPLRLTVDDPPLNLKFGVSLHLGPLLTISAEGSPHAPRESCWIVAGGQSTEKPHWALDRRRRRAIDGQQECWMVVHTPPDATAAGRLRLTARFEAGGIRRRVTGEPVPWVRDFLLGPGR